MLLVTSTPSGSTVSQPTPPPYDPNAGQQPYTPPAPAPQPYAQQPYAQQPYTQPVAPQPYAQAYPQQGYAGTVAPANNTLALVSMISGIAAFVVVPFIGSIVAIITGHMAKKQISQTGEGGSGMATAGLILGYVGIAFVVLAVVAWIALMGLAASTGGFEFTTG